MKKKEREREKRRIRKITVYTTTIKAHCWTAAVKAEERREKEEEKN